MSPPSTLAITTCGAVIRVSPSGRSSTARRCCSNWLVRAPSIVQWPLLCGRIASSLTSTPRGGVEHLDRQHAGDVEALGDAQRGLLRGQRVVLGDRRRRDDLAADAVDLHGLDDRVDRRLAVRAARDEHRQLAGERRPAPRPAARSPPAEPVGGLARPCSTTRTPLPSYPPRGVFRTTGQPTSSPNAAQRGRVVHHPPSAGTARPSSVSRARITDLSWACTSASGPGRTTTPLGLQGAQVLGRHVLVVEGEHVAALGERVQRLEVVSSPISVPGTTWAALSCGVAGQHPQRDAELDRRRRPSSGRAVRRRRRRPPGTPRRPTLPTAASRTTPRPAIRPR